MKIFPDALGGVFASRAVRFAGSLSRRKSRGRSSPFEKVWTTIRDKHWQKNPGGLDWQAIHAEYYPRIESAKSDDEALAIMREMLGRLKQTHFGIFSAAVYNDVEGEGGGEGSAGIDTRVLAGKAVVTDLDPGSSGRTGGREARLDRGEREREASGSR